MNYCAFNELSPMCLFWSIQN